MDINQNQIVIIGDDDDDKIYTEKKTKEKNCTFENKWKGINFEKAKKKIIYMDYTILYLDNN